MDPPIDAKFVGGTTLTDSGNNCAFKYRCGPLGVNVVMIGFLVPACLLFLYLLVNRLRSDDPSFLYAAREGTELTNRGTTELTNRGTEATPPTTNTQILNTNLAATSSKIGVVKYHWRGTEIYWEKREETVERGKMLWSAESIGCQHIGSVGNVISYT